VVEKLATFAAGDRKRKIGAYQSENIFRGLLKRGSTSSTRCGCPMLVPQRPAAPK